MPAERWCRPWITTRMERRASARALVAPIPLGSTSDSSRTPRISITCRLGTMRGLEVAPEEVLAGPVGWTLLGLTAIGTGVILAENAPRVQPTAPGYPQVFHESIGQGYNTDPEFGGKTPPPGWGTLGKVIFWTGVGSYVGCQFVNCDLEGGTQASARPTVSGTSMLQTSTSLNTSG